MHQQPHFEHRIREFAYQIWESEGKPDGQAHRHWEMACQLAEAQNLGQQLLNGDATNKVTRSRKKAEPNGAAALELTGIEATAPAAKTSKKAAGNKAEKPAKEAKADKPAKAAKTAEKPAKAAKAVEGAEKPKKAKKAKDTDINEITES